MLVSLMCHPERTPRVSVPDGEGYEVSVNRTPNYSDAYRFAVGRAVDAGIDLVTADSDGYHPVQEILKLAKGAFYEDAPALVLPYRENIGFQSKTYSWALSRLLGTRIMDATGGLCRLSYQLMKSLPPLKSKDMTVHVEILRHAIRSGAEVVQYPYLSGENDAAGSRRTSHYQLKLLRAAFG